MSLTAHDIETAVDRAMARHRAIDDAKHREHHAFLDYWIERENEKRQRWDRVRTTVVGGAILMLLSSIGGFLYWLGALAIEGYRRMHG